MLEKLHSVDWSKLTHAYGDASNVPDLIQELASPDRDERETAFDGLLWTIHHQGSIYNATAPAIPFILEVLESEDTLDRHHILYLLTAIAQGVGYWMAHQVCRSEEERSDPQFQQALAEEEGYVKAVREGLCNGGSLYIRLASSDDEAIRAHALQLLGALLMQLGPRTEELVQSILARVVDETTSHRRGLVALLGQALVPLENRPSDAELEEMDDFEDEEGLKGAARRSSEQMEQYHALKRIVWSGWETYQTLVTSEHPQLTEAALFVQASLLQYAAAEAPEDLAARNPSQTLLASWKEQLARATDERTQVNLLFALSSLARGSEVIPLMQELSHRTSSRLVKYVATLKLVDLDGEADQEGLGLLLESYKNPGSLVEQLHALPPWGPYQPRERLEKLGLALIERCLPQICDMIRGVLGSFQASPTRFLVKLAFSGVNLPPASTVADITQAQREILLAVVDNGSYWTDIDNDNISLRRYGLPRGRRKLREFLTRPGEPMPSPPNDPAMAQRKLNHIIADMMAFANVPERDVPPAAEDTRAPFRQIEEQVQALREQLENPSPVDPEKVKSLPLKGHACDAMMAHVANYPNVRSLNLSSGEITDEGMVHLGKLQALRTLDLRENWITDAGLVHLQKLNTLRKLFLIGTQVTDAGLASLADLTELEVLNLHGTPIEGHGLAHLAKCQHLKNLWLKAAPVNDSVFLPLGKLTALKELALGDKYLTGVGLKHLAPLVELKELTIESRSLSDQGLQELPKLPRLQKLSLSGSPITTAGLAGIDHPRLKELSLAKTQVTEPLVQALVQLSKLRGLDLTGTPITDESLKGLEAFPLLERLDLTNTAVTDEVLPELLKMKKPQWFGLTKTKITKQGVKQLKKAFRGVGIAR